MSDERKKALELFAKDVSEGLPFGKDYLKLPDSDVENNALIARNLSEDALAHQVLKNTGIPVPDKSASVLKKEDFLNRILQQTHPEIAPDLKIGNTPGAGEYSNGKIILNRHLAASQPIESLTGKALHEGAHMYDDKILHSPGKNLDLGILRKLRDSGVDLKGMDPVQVYEAYAKGHHANIPDLRQGTFGLGALQSYLKSGKFKQVAGAVPYLGTAAAIGAGLASPDASAAALDALVPGGVESLSPSPEDASIENPQASPELRRQALERLRSGR